MTDCFSLTTVLIEKNHFKNHVFPPRFMWTPVFCPKTQNMSLIFYLPCFTSDWNIYFPHFYFMLRSYATDYIVLIMMYMTLVEQHCKKESTSFFFSSSWICRHVFRAICLPVSVVFQPGASKLHGNRTWWEIVLVLLFCGKQLSTWCLYFVPFFNNKNTF